MSKPVAEEKKQDTLNFKGDYFFGAVVLTGVFRSKKGRLIVKFTGRTGTASAFSPKPATQPDRMLSEYLGIDEPVAVTIKWENNEILIE